MQNDKSKEGWAQCALASCYEKQGDNQSAAKYLEEFLTYGQNDASQNNACALACNQLGTLYNRMENFKLAVHYFEKHFVIVERKLEGQVFDEGAAKEQVKASTAQVQLAISRANEKSAMFFECIGDEKDLSRILQWKRTRSFGNSLPLEQLNTTVQLNPTV
jgi:tetratricopeptide (TPR) repeat protein